MNTKIISINNQRMSFGWRLTNDFAGNVNSQENSDKAIANGAAWEKTAEGESFPGSTFSDIYEPSFSLMAVHVMYPVILLLKQSAYTSLRSSMMRLVPSRCCDGNS